MGGHTHGVALEGVIGATRTLTPVATSHLETGEVEAETKGFYDHGCPTTQGTLTHTASPPATDHPEAAHVNRYEARMNETLENKKRN